MKCSVCGKRCNSLKAMAAHYRKKHPQRMKPKKTRSSSKSVSKASYGLKYCPCCGREM